MEVIGYNGKYLIYEDGRVFNNRTKKFLKENIDRYGYRRVNLYDGKNKVERVHRLVAKYYIPNPENKREIDHINRNKLDNRICNLRWSTRKENCNNKGIINTNKSGHTYISYCKRDKRWCYRRYNISKYFHTKIDAICYKFIMTLIK